MRIIAGKYKGRTLVTLKDRSVRPTTDRVKESIFNLIQWDVEGSKVLDLFAGSGALGIEALSRGCQSVVFNDQAKTSLSAVKENLKKVSGDYRISNRDYRAALQDFSLRGEKFDLIFLDPPYRMDMEGDILENIAHHDVLNDDGKIILERERGGSDYPLPKGIGIVDSRDYGSTTIDVLQRATKCCVTGTFDPVTLGHMDLVEEGLNRYDIVYVAVLVNPDKQCAFPLEKRLKWLRDCLAPYKKRVILGHSEGLAADYCKRYGVDTIVRGVRNETDEAYETEMADFNLKEGVPTLLLPAKRQVSSTAVRDALKNGESLEGLLPKEIIREVGKEKI